ncbi:hypothetical protein [Mycobacteroides abscessus]|uniref:hypothetical protein n=1 Tax=Mycobacteroides abscessus TaxID=36809 RepID=UPI000929F9FA|nr:hypothetical protein [Mycobacteroides abscessus]MDM2386875.1 hypothetical protein [Mycobacteroides abscessus]MDM2392023.1 hypothetical protein [Mycobacteroides abscessus]MDO3312504.1 hypothetical protein [Mycobacteroides abscessus subsp. abscessus]MDO3344814.1 hypothetical protein [Mycobacteroides abscessus subsp. abscessus]OTR15137.1 hypothetical protein B9M80_18630 [Mycobacteroides abscessus]
MISESGVTGLWCKYCGSDAPLRIEERLEAKPLGTFSLAGAQMKFSGRMWPYAVCDRCGRECRGKLA